MVSRYYLIKRPFLLLLGFHCLLRILIVIFQSDSLAFDRPLKQVSVGMAADIYISLIFSWLILLTYPLQRWLNLIANALTILASFLLALLTTNVINIYYTGSNLTWHDFSYLKDSWVLLDSLQGNFSANHGALSLAILLLLGLFYFLFRRFTLSACTNLKHLTAKSYAILFFISLAFGIGCRSYTLSARYIQHEPIESHLISFLHWRSTMNKRFRLVKPTIGIQRLQQIRAQLVNHRAATQDSHPTLPPKTNVILILLESIGQTSILEKPQIAPFLTELQKKGIQLQSHFTNAYRTCGAQFSALCSQFDPLNFYVSRNFPRSQLRCLPQIFNEMNYETAWITGTPLNFDDNGGWLARNGIKKLITQVDFSGNAERFSYGVHDGPMFDRLLQTLDNSGQPFFSYVVTASNHHPYQVPTSFKIKHPGIKTWKPYQQTYFYTDQMFARFFKQAQKRPWFANTLFIILGDHPHWGFGANPETITSYQQARSGYQTTALFYHSQLPPQIIQRDTSHIDFAPTILQLLGQPIPKSFLGSSIFGPPYHAYLISQENRRPSWFALHNKNRMIFQSALSSSCFVMTATKPQQRRTCQADEKTLTKTYRTTYLDTMQWQITHPPKKLER